METISLNINGVCRELAVGKNWTLLKTLRDGLRLTGTKCGCETGDCGACMVIIDGVATRSCLVKAVNLEGKAIETIEGLSDGIHLHPIQQAFVDAGAVQCGFCIPGMIMSAKALLDQNPDPREEEVRKAIDPNLCRCTGYDNIVKAILLAASRMETGMDNEYTVIGKPRPIGDAALKVTGQKIYVGDMELPGMLYAKVLLSTVPHARIKSIDTSAAEALPGVKAVATYKNTPQVRYNSAVRFIEHKLPDTERIFDDTVRFVGDRVAAVAAESPDIAKKAVNLIKVEYEALPVITDVEEAIKPEAWPIHEGGNIVGTSRAEAGNVDEAFQECDYVFEDRYTTQAIHHAAIEPHVAIADFAPNGKLTVYSPCQNTFAFRVIMSRIFGLSYNRIRMVAPAIGGAFGGKLEVTVEPVAAVLSQMTGKPVKVEYNRKESILSTRVRHASVNYVKTGFMKDGTLKAVDFKVYTNTGAYASSALNVSGAMSHKVFKAYKIDHMRFQCQPVYTNTEIAGAMRGYGSPQVYFGWQRQMQKIADFLHMDMADLQMKNMVDPDSCDPIFHKPHGNSRPKDCLKRALELIDYEACLKEQEATRNQDIRIGVGLALGVHGNNCVGAHRDVSTPMLKMNEDGSCIYYTGSHDMGTDTLGMQMQIVSEVLGISMDRIDCLAADTDVVHWHIGDYSSRGVFVAGSAAKKTAEAMKRELQVEAAKLLETEPDDIELHHDRAWSRKNEEKRLPSRRDGPLPVREHEGADGGRDLRGKTGSHFLRGTYRQGGSKHPDRRGKAPGICGGPRYRPRHQSPDA
jgi:CO/xanthine dehydrogenase Mo-binding subunit/aerobic-type carbon monoxide dehydrogenase small subunit (CoxS/CutS family)